MKLKACLKYLIHIICILSVIILQGYVSNKFSSKFKMTFHADYSLILLSTLIGIVLGLLLGIEHLIYEIKKSGTWRVNLPKLILLGIPTLYVSLFYITFYSNVYFIQNVIGYPLFLLLPYISLHTFDLFQLIFGYVLITSFYKKPRPQTV